MRSSGETRRRHQRATVALPVEVEHLGRKVSATSRDLSLGGVFVCFAGSLPFGDRIRLRFALPTGERELDVEAVIRWIEPGVGFGAQLVSPRAADVWALQRFLDGIREPAGGSKGGAPEPTG